MVSVEVSHRGAVVWIRLERPDRANSLSAELVEDLIQAVGQAAESNARLLVLSGRGRTFCGGFDLSDLDRESDASLAHRFLRIEMLLQALYYAPLYTVALAHGNVSGAGADLVAACARRIAAPETVFRFPGIRFGVLLGTRRLAELVGSRARSIVLQQETVDAEEALRIGLVDRLAQPPEWEPMIERIAAEVVASDRDAVRSVMGIDRHAGDRDLGTLARSVAEPGLKERIQAYWRDAQAARKGRGRG